MNILITGCNRGIGLEFVKQYLHEGANIIACCRHPEKAVALQQLQKEFPRQLTIETLDVRDEKNILALAKKLNHIALDILLNNAGIYGASNIRLGTLTQKDFLPLFETNCIAPVLMTQAFISHLEHGQLKTIINISTYMASIAQNIYGDAYYYRASKTALNAASKSLAIDLSAKKMKVLLLDPGWAQTDMGGKDATVPVDISVNGMRKVIANTILDDSGKFFSYEGNEVPW